MNRRYFFQRPSIIEIFILVACGVFFWWLFGGGRGSAFPEGWTGVNTRLIKHARRLPESSQALSTEWCKATDRERGEGVPLTSLPAMANILANPVEESPVKEQLFEFLVAADWDRLGNMTPVAWTGHLSPERQWSHTADCSKVSGGLQAGFIVYKGADVRIFDEALSESEWKEIFARLPAQGAVVSGDHVRPLQAMDR